MNLEQLWRALSEDDRRILLAALWYSLGFKEHMSVLDDGDIVRMNELASFTLREEESIKRSHKR